MINRKLAPFLILAVTGVTALALGRAFAGGAENVASAFAAPTEKTNTMNIQITVANKAFTATLEESTTAKAFKELLPMRVRMTELNGNEKYFRLLANLPTNASNPGTIQTGDLMIYGENTVVLFYETFRTSYSYTRLGRINHTAGLAEALGSEDVTIKYELQQKPKGT